MEYILIEHADSDIDEPSKIYSELDGDRREQRRVEFYPTGLCFAYGQEHGHDEVLTVYPADLSELETDEDTTVRTVRANIFQEIWNHAAETPDNIMDMFL